MALILNLTSIAQSNDNTILRLVDNTGIYSTNNIGGWGTPNTTLSSINGTTNKLTISISINTSDGTTTDYDPIDIYNYLGHSPSTVDDLLIYVTANLLKVNGIAIGTDEDELPDGWYSIVYKASVISTNSEIDSYSVQLLVDGVVRNKIYNMLLLIPRTTYESTPLRISVHDWRELTYPLYVLSLFEGMIAYVTPSRKNEILETLNLIERLTS